MVKYSKDLTAAAHVRFTSDTADQLAAIAEREGQSRPAIIRQAIARYLADQSAARKV